MDSIHSMNSSTNLSVIRLHEGEPVLWRAGAAHCVPMTADIELPSDVIFAAPGDQLRLLVLDTTPDESKHLRKSLPFMLEENLVEDVATLHFAHQRIADDSYRVAVCRYTIMEAWQHALETHSQQSVRYLPEPMLLPWQSGEWTLLFEQDSTLLRDAENTGTRIESSLLPLLLSAAESMPSALVVYGEDRDAALAVIPPDWHDKVQWRQGNFATALLLTENPVDALDLRQGDFAPRLPVARWWGLWRNVAIVAGVALLLQLGSEFLQLRQLSAENNVLRSAIQESYRRANPKGAVVDVEKQLDRQLKSLVNVSGGVALMPFLQRVSAALAATDGVSLTTLNYSAGAREIRLNIMAPDYAAVESLRNRLAAAKLDATLESSSAAAGQVRARLRIEDGV